MAEDQHVAVGAGGDPLERARGLVLEQVREHADVLELDIAGLADAQPLIAELFA